MNNYLKSNKWFSIIMALGIVTIILFNAYFILSYIIPFSKATKWVENSSIAYYQAYKWIENWLWFIGQNEIGSETWSTIWNSQKSSTLNLTAKSSTIPPSWQWNSEYSQDKNWNIISLDNPIQLVIWNWKITDWNNVIFNFRVPNIWNANSLTWNTDYKYIHWSISSENNTLNASWSQITKNDIITYDWYDKNLKFTDNNIKNWTDLDWNSTTFNNFYNTNCSNSIDSCTLKLSIINKLELTNWTSIPYLEYKIELPSWNSIPSRYARIDIDWTSYWYKKNLKVKVPQLTTNQAFDFTVFQ